MTKAEEDDLEFQIFVRELSIEMSAGEYVYFDADVPTSEQMIREHEVDWRERLQEHCINAITTKSNVNKEAQETSDDNDVEKEDDTQEEEVSFVESLAMIDKLKKCSFLDDGSQMMVSILTRKFEDLQIKNKKQKLIKYTSVSYTC